MGTRATIKFKDRWDEFYVYRGHDGHPENVLADINETLDLAKGRWSDSETGQLISLFLTQHGNLKQRIQDYEITPDFHGDESFRFLVQWDDDNDKWVASIAYPNVNAHFRGKQMLPLKSGVAPRKVELLVRSFLV